MKKASATHHTIFLYHGGSLFVHQHIADLRRVAQGPEHARRQMQLHQLYPRNFLCKLCRQGKRGGNDQKILRALLQDERVDPGQQQQGMLFLSTWAGLSGNATCSGSCVTASNSCRLGMLYKSEPGAPRSAAGNSQSRKTPPHGLCALEPERQDQKRVHIPAAAYGNNHNFHGSALFL